MQSKHGTSLLLPIIPISANKILDVINVKSELRVINEIKKENTLDISKELGNVEILFKKVE